MKLPIPLCCVVTLLLVSACEKAYSPGDLSNNPSTGQNPNNPMLIKMVSESSTDTTINNFEYNTLGQLLKFTIDERGGQTAESSYYRFIRDSVGKVVGFVHRIVAAGASGTPDSIVWNIHYPAGSQLFDYRAATYQSNGQRISDSVAFFYTNGRMIAYEEYLGSSGTTAASILRSEYAYDGNGNLVYWKLYDHLFSKSNNLSATFQFDDKINPLNTGIEWYLIGAPNAITRNNVTKMTTIIDDGTHKDTTATAFNYQYNAQNLPATAVQTDDPGNGTTKITYYYK